MKNIKTSFFVVLFSLSTFAQYKCLPESDYAYWPSYNYLDSKESLAVKAQQWQCKNHTILGWDWSFPKKTKLASNSLVGLQRRMGTEKAFLPLKYNFPVNPVGILWVTWKDIEKEEGVYDFSKIEERIDQANSDGNEIILRILAHNVSRGNDDQALKRGAAPLWLKKYNIPTLPKKSAKHNLNYDPSHPEFHKRYVKLIDALGKTTIPKKVKAAYVGYASNSLGDEGIGPIHNNGKKNDTIKHVRERLEVFAKAFKGMENKVFMGGPSEYGFSLGFGVRRGFVEMYLYTIPDKTIGQYIDAKGYLRVDESRPIIANNSFNGEVNEEYEPAWATAQRGYRFGMTTNSYTYRYFISNLRALQMRCSYMHIKGHLIPEMLPFIAQELGRTVENTPDVWSFLYSSKIKKGQYVKGDYKNRKITAEENKHGLAVKNFERWLYQRDAEGYYTKPAVKINHAIKMWMVPSDHYYDFIARQGSQIGFDIDDRWLVHNEKNEFALKVTYLDNEKGVLQVIYNKGNSTNEIELFGDGKLKTTTFLIKDMKENSLENDFDFVLKSKKSTKEITISMVRLVKF